MSEQDRWYRAGDWPIWTFDTSAPEWRRLERAAADTGLLITPLAIAAQVISDRTGCELREAWDRLAFNLERMHAGQWPPTRVTALALVHPMTTMEMYRC